MRISELSRRCDVPVPTIKYYLREGLLHGGRLTAATQAQYDDTHVSRLRLVRALLGPGGLSVARTRAVLEAIDSPPSNLHELLGVAQAAAAPAAGTTPAHPRVHALLQRWGWRVGDDCASHTDLAAALHALDDAGFVVEEALLDTYAHHLRAMAEAELAGVPTGSVTDAVRYVVLGTVLVEPLLLALRRLAEQDASARLFGAASSTS